MMREMYLVKLARGDGDDYDKKTSGQAAALLFGSLSASPILGMVARRAVKGASEKAYYDITHSIPLSDKETKQLIRDAEKRLGQPIVETTKGFGMGPYSIPSKNVVGGEYLRRQPTLAHELGHILGYHGKAGIGSAVAHHLGTAVTMKALPVLTALAMGQKAGYTGDKKDIAAAALLSTAAAVPSAAGTLYSEHRASKEGLKLLKKYFPESLPEAKRVLKSAFSTYARSVPIRALSIPATVGLGGAALGRYDKSRKGVSDEESRKNMARRLAISAGVLGPLAGAVEALVTKRRIPALLSSLALTGGGLYAAKKLYGNKSEKKK